VCVYVGTGGDLVMEQSQKSVGYELSINRGVQPIPELCIQ